MKRYFEGFNTVKDVIDEFGAPSADVTDKEILFAYYGYGSYCGIAEVLFQRNGKLYEVRASHCSCYGLEGRWYPDEVTWDQLAMRPDHGTYFESDREGAEETFKKLIRKHVPRA